MLTVTDAPAIRLLVIDDHPVVVHGVRTLLEHDPNMSVVGDASTAEQGVHMARRLQPDVVLLDFRLPQADLGGAVEALRSAAPSARIVVFTAYGNPAAMAIAVAAKVDGYMLKDAAEGAIVGLLHRVVAGESVFQPPCRDASSPHVSALSGREIEVLRHVAMGRTNAEVAHELALAPNTVKAYLQSAMHKLGARNRLEAVLSGSDLGIL